MAEHTPGPWKKVPRVRRGGVDGVVIGALKAVAIVAHQDDNDEFAANVNLIHAAPDLLEAAKAVDALLENLWESVPWGETFGVDMKALNEAPIALKAAIAKATDV